MSDFCNDANDLRAITSELREKKRKIEETIEHVTVLFRLIEHSEPYSTSVLERNLKQDYFTAFCKSILTEDIKPILVEYPKFANALFNALLIHDVNNMWTRFFNVYDMSLFGKDKLEEAVKAIGKNSRFIKSSEDYMVLDNLFNHIEGVESTFDIEERRLFDEITDENMDDDVMPAVA